MDACRDAFEIAFIRLVRNRHRSQRFPTACFPATRGDLSYNGMRYPNRRPLLKSPPAKVAVAATHVLGVQSG
jgi:hypothetical protein